ncbi:MAG: hypothetical protein IJI43_00500 [Bacilli bacterium]|nr:hypothetical protein [Bacilli bacterium]
MDNKDSNDLFDMYGSGGTRKENSEVEATSTDLPVQEPLINTDNDESEEASISESETQEMPLPVEEPVVDSKAIPDSVIKDADSDNEKLSEEDLLKIYVGNNYEAIAKGGLSFLSFFLGAWYLFYRKQYKYALPWLGLVCIGTIFNSIVPAIYYIFLLISFGIGIYFTITFKKNYMDLAKKKTNEIFNMDISNSDKKKMARELGGVNSKTIFVFLIYLVLVSTIMAPLIKNRGDKLVVEDDVEFKIPSWAEDNIKDEPTSTTNRDEYQYSDKLYTYKDSKNECIIRLSSNNEYVTVDGNVKARNYMEEVLNKEFAFTDKVYNKVPLLYYYDNERDNYYYIYASKNVMQLLKVTIKKDDTLKCTKLMNDMVESVKYLKKN